MLKNKDMEEKELIQRKSYTSFGRLILADEKTNPIFSNNISLFNILSKIKVLELKESLLMLEGK